MVFSVGEASEHTKKYALKDRSILCFKDPSGLSRITLKGTRTKLIDYMLTGSDSVNVSYIVNINDVIADGGLVYLSLQDKEGFEIARKMLDGVAEGFRGDLKGNFTLEPRDCRQIAYAELFIMKCVDR